MTDYQPVDCGLHSQYELAILQRRRLQIDWHDGAGTAHSDTVTPLDLLTRNREEFLLVQDTTGTEQHIRLDRILGCTFL